MCPRNTPKCIQIYRIFVILNLTRYQEDEAQTLATFIALFYDKMSSISRVKSSILVVYFAKPFHKYYTHARKSV